MGRLRGQFEARWSARGPRRGPVGVAVFAVVVGGLGLSGCVNDAPPVMGVATGGDGQAAVSWFPPHASPARITGYVVTPWIGLERQTPVAFGSTATTETIIGL